MVLTDDVTSMLEGTAPEWSCERAGECDNEAVYVAFWMPENEGTWGDPVDPCTCGPHSYNICLPCYETFSQRASGLGWCYRCSPTGPMRFKTLTSVRPVRR